MCAKTDTSGDEMNAVPGSFDEITPAWCEWALKKDGTIGENTTVTTAKVERFKDEITGEVNDGGGLTGAKLIRINLGYGGETNGGEPESVVSKIMFESKETVSLPWRIVLYLTGAWDLTSEDFWRTDIKFFRNILPVIETKYKSPKVYYTGIMDNGNRNFFTSTILNRPCKVKTVTLMEDMKNWDGLTLTKLFNGKGIDLEDAAECLRNLAVLHATFWGENKPDIQRKFKRLSFMESTARPQAHSKMYARKRNKFISTADTIQKGVQTVTQRWQHESYMTISAGNKSKIPDWFTAEPLEDGSWPILKDPLILEMLNACAERFPAFAKSVANPHLKKPMQTICHGDFQVGNHMYGKNENKGKIVAVDFQCVGMGMAVSEVLFYNMWTLPAKNFIESGKVYHDALVRNGVDDYPWDAFKKDLITEVMEHVIKTTLDFSEYTMKKYEQLFRLFGDKAEGFKVFLEGGVCGMAYILATDLYLRDKENFLHCEAFDKNI